MAGARQTRRRAPIPPRIPRAQSPRTLAEVGRSRNPAGGNRRGLRSHNSDSRGIGGDRGLSNSRSIISHARAGKGSNLLAGIL